MATLEITKPLYSGVFCWVPWLLLQFVRKHVSVWQKDMLMQKWRNVQSASPSYALHHLQLVEEGPKVALSSFTAWITKPSVLSNLLSCSTTEEKTCTFSVTRQAFTESSLHTRFNTEHLAGSWQHRNEEYGAARPPIGTRFPGEAFSGATPGLHLEGGKGRSKGVRPTGHCAQWPLQRPAEGALLLKGQYSASYPDIGNLFSFVDKRNWVGIFIQKSQAA